MRSAIDAANVLRLVGANLATYERAEAVSDRTWRWNGEAILFPETLCPVCKQGVPNKAIWLVTGTTSTWDNIPRLRGQAIPVHGERLVLERPNHPHAYDNGTLCYGDVGSNNIVQALFLGINPESPINEPGPWFHRYCDHDMAGEERARRGRCETGNTRCPGCGRSAGCRINQADNTCGDCWPNGECPGCHRRVIACPCRCNCTPIYGACGCCCAECVCDEDADDDYTDDPDNDDANF